MKNTMEYKGYLGSVEFDEEEGLLFGRVMGIRSLISYEGESAKELLEDFHGAVDDYLELCRAEGKTPETAYKGSFNVRISPELHKQLAVYAMEHDVSLNTAWSRRWKRRWRRNNRNAHIVLSAPRCAGGGFFYANGAVC